MVSVRILAGLLVMGFVGAAAIPLTLQSTAEQPGGKTEAARVQLAQSKAASDSEGQRRQFGDWFMLCPAEAAQRQGCTIGHQLNRSEGNRLVFGITLRRAAEGRLAASFHTPLGVSLSRGIVLRIDEQEPVRVGFTVCRPGQCQANASLSPEVVSRIIGAGRVIVTFHTAADQPVNVGVSRDGLEAAFAALEAQGASSR